MENNVFDSIKIGLASPEQIRAWSYGEVKKPETINYRTLKPERDGLYCERIFGPTKDWECHCGKYKRIRYKGKVCDRCGVEVTKAKVRRERMGHIELAAPVSHIWYFKGIPSRIGLMLDISPRLLEKVLYFASYIVTDPGLTPLDKKQLLTEKEYREMRDRYGDEFEAAMGAEAVQTLLKEIDLDQLSAELTAEVEKSSGQKRVRILKRLEVVEAFRISGNRPEWMIMDVLPVLPPDLRPMVQLDGGRFATSDLNDLYRRVINRNNRLRRLLELGAPDIIVRNEKRMLQEAVDSLIDNGRRGRPVTGPNNRALKSLSDLLKGKQGRFRQNLLGKRVDYSGRSVIVTDPKLLLHQCGLPKAMALELFKPFVVRRLVELNRVDNVKAAKRAIDRVSPVVWDVLDEVIQDRLVLLNRAPTLHRLSIQAFEPVLVEGKAIHLHPLVCAPFNADFDGDQMSVHVPLSTQAQTEARVLMLSSNNLRSPASGKVLTVPSQDMVFGVYYLTTVKEGARGEGRVFADLDDAVDAFDSRGEIDIQAGIVVRIRPEDANVVEDGRRLFRVMTGKGVTEDLDVTDGPVRLETTAGRLIFNRQCLPADYPFMNYKMAKGDISFLVNDCCDRYPLAEVEPILDAIKYAGFHYATRAGLTVSVWDAATPQEKRGMLDEAQDAGDQINENYEDGLLSEAERHSEVVNTWNACAEELGSKMLDGFSEDNPIYMMADSGARGTKTQLRQLAAMRGLMNDMSGETIDLPIKANFREGLEPLEYFISTYGARKGLVDTASHTSDSGYLTRRLVDVAQDVIVREEDCDTTEGVTYGLMRYEDNQWKLNADLVGRCTLNDVCDPETGEVLIPAEGYITSVDDVQMLLDHGLKEVELRALLTCRSKYGVCQKCYGWDLSTRRPVTIGTAVGIIAAQSIGEPGTQLTMRTIHSGGVAGADDITQGLPTVARMFDVVGNVNEKILGREADLAWRNGVLHITPEQTEYVLRIDGTDALPEGAEPAAEKRVPASVQFMPGIEDGCEVIAYNPWSFTDLLSTGNGMAKRYGLVYIDTTDEEQNAAKSVEELSMKRIRKDSFYWYSKLIRSNGQDWGKEMLK